jgi:uncharacterized protein (TIGR02271 family)
MSTTPHASPTTPEVVLHEERLRVQTRQVPVERVVLRRRIVTEVRQVEVTVRREELEIDRGPVEGADLGGRGAQAPRTTTIVLREEVPVVQVQTRPYEQVTVTVEQVQDQRQVSVELGRERVEVDVDPQVRVVGEAAGADPQRTRER